MAAGKRRIPENSSVVIPRLFCRDPVAELEFCVDAFGAVELGRRQGPDGAVLHALLTIADEMVMIESEWPTLPSRVPELDGSSPVVIFLYVDDVDGVVERAVELGAETLIAPANQFWGDRTAWIMDPAGHVWTLASRVEETTAEEREERWSALQRPDGEPEREQMADEFPGAIPEVPVTDLGLATAYYENQLGFSLDWGGEAGGIAGVSRGSCRLFLTSREFREGHGNAAPVLIWLNMNSREEVDDVHEVWSRSQARIVSTPEPKPWNLYEFTAADLDGNLFRVFYDFRWEEDGR